MENLQGMSDMLHNKRRKCKGENHCRFKILTARNDASEESAFTIFHLSFSIIYLPFKMKSKWKMANDKWKIDLSQKKREGLTTFPSSGR
jgi:hypothetical protein